MARAILLLAAVLGWATAASAGTLTVSTTDLADNPKNLFTVGETFLLKVVGDSEGGTDNAIGGTLFWNGALTTTVVNPPGCNGSNGLPCTTPTQGDWLPVKGSLFPSDGSVWAFNQIEGTPGENPPATNPVDTSVIALLADQVGATTVTWGGEILDFFGIYFYDSNGIDPIPTGHSFTITPEPATVALIALGLLAIGARRRT